MKTQDLQLSQVGTFRGGEDEYKDAIVMKTTNGVLILHCPKSFSKVGTYIDGWMLDAEVELLMPGDRLLITTPPILSTPDADAKLGDYYLKKYCNDYEEAEKELRRLEITRTSYANGIYTITLRRPGLLIGCKGTNIYDLEDYLGFKVRIVEETAMDPYSTIVPISPDEVPF